MFLLQDGCQSGAGRADVGEPTGAADDVKPGSDERSSHKQSIHKGPFSGLFKSSRRPYSQPTQPVHTICSILITILCAFSQNLITSTNVTLKLILLFSTHLAQSPNTTDAE